MTVTTNLVSRLTEVIGAAHVVTAPKELPTYAVDGLAPVAIVRPVSADQVAEVVRLAVADRLALLPLGSRSKSEIGMTPGRYDIAVDMNGLHEIAHYDAGDLTLSVDAGLSLRELRNFLRGYGQFLPYQNAGNRRPEAPYYIRSMAQALPFLMFLLLLNLS